ncbi:MAG TPA: hypothetical protein VF240_18580 [Pyrinomonadaceae bacterium]
MDLRTHAGRGAGVPRRVYLRELSGYDELASGSAVELIDRLLVERPGAAARPGDARRLTLAEADRVLAAVYRSLYGDDIECHVSCPACRSSYALSFTLTDMWTAVTETTPEDEQLLDELAGPDEDGVYHLDGFRFRLPTGEDLAEVAGLGTEGMAEALRARCVLEENAERGEETLDHAMTLAGPTLDTDLDGVCPECGAEQAVPFRIDEFLFAALRRESALLTREVHELARAYRWSRREILEMPRRERRQHAGLVLAAAAPDGGWA